MAKKRNNYSPPPEKEENNDNQGLFLISVVSKMLNVHPQTLRLYEREGFITPRRTKGGVRLYSNKDIQKLELILRLTRDLGVNLAGVQIIIDMREKMDQMQREFTELLNYIRNELKKEISDFEEKLNKALVRAPKTTVIQIEKIEEKKNKS